MIKCIQRLFDFAGLISRVNTYEQSRDQIVSMEKIVTRGKVWADNS